MRVRRPIAICCSVTLLCGCGSESEAGGGGGPLAVATTTQVADFAREVAGERAQVRQILRPNADPHGYEPRPSDVRAVADAAVVLRSGGDLDAWLQGVLDNAGAGAETVVLADGLPHTRDGDPHWWQDPRNAAAAVQRVRDALIEADPGGRAQYAANADRYLAQLGALDRSIARCMRAVPAAKRKLVTDHDALGYFADRYAIDVVGTVIPARSTQAQASAGDVARLTDAIRAAGVTTIFPESSVNPKLARGIARESGAKVGPALYADTLGEAGTPGETYLGALRFNAAAIADAFGAGCQL